MILFKNDELSLISLTSCMFTIIYRSSSEGDIVVIWL